jgi:hypothetical protein
MAKTQIDERRHIMP